MVEVEPILPTVIAARNKDHIRLDQVLSRAYWGLFVWGGGGVLLGSMIR